MNRESARVKTPTILQMEATECGAAALAIVLAYYGLYISSAEMRAACGVSRDGSRATNMLKAARNYGLKAQAAEVEQWKDLFSLPLPCIVFWKFNHFVVLEGMDKDKIYINDPAVGPREITHDEFDSSFTGIVLILEPDVAFQRGGEPPSLFRTIRQGLKNFKDVVAYIVLVSLALVIPGVVIPGFSKIFIDDILIKQTQHWFIPLILGMVLAAILRGVFTWLQQIHLLHFQIQLVKQSTLKFFRHILYLPMQFFSQRYAGDLAERVAANERIAHILSGNVSGSLVSMITILFYAIVMLLINWQIALIGIFVAFINGYILYLTTRRIANRTYQFLQERGQMMGLEMNGLQMIESLKSNGLEKFFFQRWAGLHARTVNRQQSVAIYSVILQVVPQFLSAITTVSLLGLGSWFVMRGQLTLGSLVALQSLMASFNSPLQTLLSIGSELPKIQGDISRLEDVLHHSVDPRFLIDYPVQTENSLRETHQLSVSHITFGYSLLDPPLLENFSLTIKPHQRIAIVGATGSGKSTIAKIIAALYQPWKGKIEWGGISIDNIAPIAYSKIFSIVDQDIFLFSGTIRDNITLWDDSILDENIQKSLEDAGVLDVIITRGGLDSEISDGGVNFSGGQRQRLEIARALVTNPAFLILDEATSALEPALEKNILNHLKKRGCAVILITHRLSSITDFDDIVVLEQGKIVQQGTHASLIQKEGLYRKMVLMELNNGTE